MKYSKENINRDIGAQRVQRIGGLRPGCSLHCCVFP